MSATQYCELSPELEGEFDSLDELLRGIVAVGELSPRSSDYVVSYGERLNSTIVAEAYRARGIRSALVDARKVMITDAQHGKAIPQADQIEHRAKNLIAPTAGGRAGSRNGRIHWRN